MQDLNIQMENDSEEIVLILEGEIDLNNIQTLEKALKEAGKENKNIIIDMDDVRFIDSTGIGLLVKTYKTLKQVERTLTVRNAKGNVRKVFKITCLEDVFNMGVE